MSINALTADQIGLMCRQVDELVDAGVSLNLAIRTLETAVDTTAKHLILGNASPHSADQVPKKQWSVAARAAHCEDPRRPPKEYLRVEHGTPRRAFTRLVLDAYRLGELNQSKFESLVERYWKVAVVTLEEDARLMRSQMMDTPDQRWAAAGIKF
ncbi:hypothetical protein [Tsuneonella mangrovi]|uniref:hypothetical protein n=1 Tax=Tsuneonella mangrovi TaxID=1982042 RepID=UPI000BA265DF|nr:hypothetical protein [Tsuneonella mangrovi]